MTDYVDGIYKPSNKTVLQLWSKDSSFLPFNQSYPIFRKILQAWHLMMQE